MVYTQAAKLPGKSKADGTAPQGTEIQMQMWTSRTWFPAETSSCRYSDQSR